MFYSSAFAAAVPMFRWFVLGCLGRVFSWPLGAVFMAKGASTALLVSVFVFAAIHIAAVWAGIRLWGPVGSSVAFCGLYVLYFIGVFLFMRRWIGFRMTRAVGLVMGAVLAGVAAAMAASQFLPFHWRQVTGVTVASCAGDPLPARPRGHCRTQQQTRAEIG